MVKPNVQIRADLLLTESPNTPGDFVAEKRHRRKMQVLDAIRCHEPIPRVQIAKILGFNLPSVSSLVDELVGEGLATEDKAQKTAIGRRPIPVWLNRQAAVVVGIDVGKTRLMGMTMNLGGEILNRLEQPSPASLDMDKLPALLEEFIGKLLIQHAHTMPPLAGLGVALPGLIYQAGPEGTYTLVPKARALRRHLRQWLGVPVIVENDVRMMAYGVLRFDNEQDLRNMAIVNIGYGLGAGIVIDGQVYKGAHGYAGELGQLPLGEPGVSWHTGVNCCLENIASGAGLERMAREAGITHEGHPATSANLAQLARNGSSAALEVFDRFTRALAQGLSTLVNLFNPEAIVLVGRVSRAADLFEEPLRRALAQHTLPTLMENTRIIVSDLHENSGALGTCACVLHHLYTAAQVPQ